MASFATSTDSESEASLHDLARQLQQAKEKLARLEKQSSCLTVDTDKETPDESNDTEGKRKAETSLQPNKKVKKNHDKRAEKSVSQLSGMSLDELKNSEQKRKFFWEDADKQLADEKELLANQENELKYLQDASSTKATSPKDPPPLAVVGSD